MDIFKYRISKYETEFFYKKIDDIGPQNQMFKYGEIKKDKFYIRYEYLKNNRCYRMYGSYKNFKPFKKILLEKKEKLIDVTFHEIIREISECKLFFDLDFKNITLDSDISKKIVIELEKNLKKFIDDNNLWKYINKHPLLSEYSDSNNYIILDIVTSNKKIGNKYKISLHLTSNQIFFKNILEQKKFIKNFLNYIKDKNPTSMLLDLIDIQVYRKNGSLRTVYSNKLDENRICSPEYNDKLTKMIGDYDINSSLDNFFITVIDKSNEIIFFEYEFEEQSNLEPFIDMEYNIPTKNKNKKKIKPINNYQVTDLFNNDENYNKLSEFLPPGPDCLVNDKIKYVEKLLNKIPDNYFNEDANGFRRRLLLTFSVADYLDSDKTGLLFYLNWLKNKRDFLKQKYDPSLAKYKDAYIRHKKKNGHCNINYILKLVLM
jgi:hypothetical protein